MALRADRPTSFCLSDLVDLHGAELRRHLVGMLGERDDAEDVLQEVWITAQQHVPTLGPDANVRAWLYRVATNTALSRLSRDRRRRAALEGRKDRLTPDGQSAPDAAFRGLSERARARVRARVARLPRKQRDAVWLRWAVGADYSTIACELDCSEDSARANVYNGMKRLRGELFDLWRKEYVE